MDGGGKGSASGTVGCVWNATVSPDGGPAVRASLGFNRSGRHRPREGRGERRRR